MHISDLEEYYRVSDSSDERDHFYPLENIVGKDIKIEGIAIVVDNRDLIIPKFDETPEEKNKRQYNQALNSFIRQSLNYYSSTFENPRYMKLLNFDVDKYVYRNYNHTISHFFQYIISVDIDNYPNDHLDDYLISKKLPLSLSSLPLNQQVENRLRHSYSWFRSDVSKNYIRNNKNIYKNLGLLSIDITRLNYINSLLRKQEKIKLYDEYLYTYENVMYNLLNVSELDKPLILFKQVLFNPDLIEDYIVKAFNVSTYISNDENPPVTLVQLMSGDKATIALIYPKGHKLIPTFINQELKWYSDVLCYFIGYRGEVFSKIGSFNGITYFKFSHYIPHIDLNGNEVIPSLNPVDFTGINLEIAPLLIEQKRFKDLPYKDIKILLELVNKRVTKNIEADYFEALKSLNELGKYSPVPKSIADYLNNL